MGDGSTVMSLTEREQVDPPELISRAKELRLRAHAGEITDPDQVTALIDIVADGVDRARSYAVDALETVGEKHPSLFASCADELVELAVSGPEPAAPVGLKSLARLTASDPESIGAGLEAAGAGLAAEAPEVRAAALEVIAEAGERAAPVLAGRRAAIEASLAHAETEVRSAAVHAVGATAIAVASPDRELIAGLFPRLCDEAAPVRRRAFRSLIAIAIERPETVPEPGVTAERLGEATDADLGLSAGTVDRATERLEAVANP